MRGFYKVFIYDLKMVIRQKEALFWLFLFPILIMVIFGFIFGSTGSLKLRIGLVDEDGSQVSEAIVQAFQEIDALVVDTGTREAEREALKDGKRNGILIFPAGFGEKVLSGQPAEVLMVVNKSEVSTAQVTSSTLQGIMTRVSQAMSGAPPLIELREEEEKEVKDFEYIDFMVPGILAMVIMFSGLTGYALETATNREKGILRRIKVSSLPLSSFISGGIASVLAFSLLQTVALLSFGALVFRLRIRGNYLYIAVLVLLGTLTFLALGFMIASLARNSRSAGLAAQAVGLPMMFLSGIFFSVEWVPTPMKVIARCLPLYYLGDGLRGVMIDGASLSDIWLDLAVLCGVCLAAFLAAVRFFRWE